MGRLTLMAMAPSGRLEAKPLARQEIMHGHVLVPPPGERALANGRLAQLPAPTVEVLEGPAHAEIAGGADITATQVPGEEPFSRPTPEATDGGEGLDHLVVRVAGEGDEFMLARGAPTGGTTVLDGHARRSLE